MFRKNMLMVTAAVFLGFGLAVPIFSVPALADSVTPTNPSVAVAKAKRAEQTDLITYHALVNQATSILKQVAFSGSGGSALLSKQGVTILQADINALSHATTVAETNTSLKRLKHDAEKLQEILSSDKMDSQTKRQNSLEEAIRESEKTLKKQVSRVESRIHILQTETASLPSTPTREQVKRVVKDTSKLTAAVVDMNRKFTKWDAKLKTELRKLDTITRGGSNMLPTPPSPPASISGSLGTAGMSSGAGTPQPPAPPSNS